MTSERKIWDRITARQDSRAHAATMWNLIAESAVDPYVDVDEYNIGPLFEDVSEESIGVRVAWMVGDDGWRVE